MYLFDKQRKLLKIQKTTIFALSNLAEIRDPETGEHLSRIRNYALLIGQLLRYTKYKEIVNDQFLKDLFDSSILHDIGKIGIADDILLKEGPLTEKEREIMHQHTTIGFDALSAASQGLEKNHSFLQMAMEIILHHHESWDGTGYPSNLKGEEIPLAARIVTLTDVYDALCTKRPYKDAYTHAESIQIIKDNFFRFDPIIFNIFLDNNLSFNMIRAQCSETK